MDARLSQISQSKATAGLMNVWRQSIESLNRPVANQKKNQTESASQKEPAPKPKEKSRPINLINLYSQSAQNYNRAKLTGAENNFVDSLRRTMLSNVGQLAEQGIYV